MAGARVVAIDGNFDQALGIVRALAEQDDHPVTLVNSVNPFRLEGQKTAAFEICDDLGRAPDVLAIPVGNAGNISAYWAGLPRLRGGRRHRRDARGCGASRPPARRRSSSASGSSDPETVATAIRIGDPASWTMAIAARDESGGRIDAVTDDEILAAYRDLARLEGIFCEPASAASVAGVSKAAAAGEIDPDATVVCVLTGHGLKDPTTAERAGRGPIARGRADASARSPWRSAGERWSPTGSPSSTAARSTVEVPASSANLGAGYDCLGRGARADQPVELEVRGWSRGEIELTVEGEGHDELTEDRENRFVRGLEAALEGARGELPAGVGWRIAMHNQIPLSRGLGSSAAATVAGVRRRQRARSASRCRSAELLRLAADDRGPPRQRGRRAPRRVRRSAPATAGRRRGGPVRRPARPAGGPVHPRPAPPDRGDARGPARARPAGRRGRQPRGASALGVAGLATGRYDLLARLTVDRLHEPYRAAAYPQLPRSWSRRRATRARSARACRAPARRSSPSPIRWPGSPGSKPRSSPPRPTPTCPVGSRSSSRATPARRSSRCTERSVDRLSDGSGCRRRSLPDEGADLVPGGGAGLGDGPPPCDRRSCAARPGRSRAGGRCRPPSARRRKRRSPRA